MDLRSDIAEVILCTYPSLGGFCVDHEDRLEVADAILVRFKEVLMSEMFRAWTSDQEITALRRIVRELYHKAQTCPEVIFDGTHAPVFQRALDEENS